MPDKERKETLLLPDNTGDSQPKRDPGGRFVPGRSGNPAGRPFGSRNKASALLSEKLDGEWQAVTDGLVAAAKAGNAAAARAVLDRVAPRPRGRVVQLDLPRLATLDDVDAAVDLVIDAIAAGQVTPQEAATVAGILETKRRVIDSRALDDRVRAIEDKLTGVPLH